MKLKEKIYSSCRQLLDDRIILFNQSLRDLRESSKNETKSSAGDKYETARAMLQIEQENIGRQLNEANAQKDIVDRIDISIASATVIPGSLVKTNRGYLFMSTALGKLIVDGIAVIALSPQSPLGMKLMGAGIQDSIEMNGIQYRIETIQ